MDSVALISGRFPCPFLWHFRDKLGAAIQERIGEVSSSGGMTRLNHEFLARRDIVAKTVMLDPVALLLAQPDVAYNFLYRRAKWHQKQLET